MSKGKVKKIVENLISFVNGLVGIRNPIVLAIIHVVKLSKGKVICHIEKNKASEIGGEGKTDFAEYAGILSFVVLAGIGLVFVAQGKITFEQLIKLLDLL